MDNNFHKENNKKDSYYVAVEITWKEFRARHSMESLPEWFTKCVRVSGTKNSVGNWLIKFTVLPKIKLEPNQQWEVRNGTTVLTEVDPITGKKCIVICGGPAVDVEVLFMVEVDHVNGSSKVITDTNLELLDGTKYELNNY